ncbi:MAG: DUF2953 domain-containing protein [Bacillota bacterium]|nr:DUF2953 domain-containing protein [Bacillota bacterium]
MIYFLIILLFIPIPIIIKIKYMGKLDIYIYNKKIVIHRNKGKKKSAKRKKFKIFWKPYIKVNIDLLYGFDDAAATAISYGLIFSVLPLIKGLLSKFFNVKGFSQDIKLDYERKTINLYIRCIILINIAQIIVDLIYIIYFNLKRGVLYGKSSNRQSNEKHHGKS